MRLIALLEATGHQEMLSGGAGILVYVPSTGRILVQIRGEHPDDLDSGKYDVFGGTLEEGETAEECARREAKEEGGLEFPEGGLEELGAFSSTEGGEWDGEPYHVFLRIEDREFPVKVDKKEVEKAKWIEPSEVTDDNATNRLVKAAEHEKLKSAQHNKLAEAQAKYWEDLNPQEQESARALRRKELEALLHLNYPVEAEFSGERVKVLGPADRFPPYDTHPAKAKEAWKGAIQQLVVGADGQRFIMMASGLVNPSTGKPLVTRFPPERERDKRGLLAFLKQAQGGLEESQGKLTEATYDTDEDVDYIFNTYYKRIFDAIRRRRWNGNDLQTSFPAYRLPSETAKRASNVIPAMVYVNLSSEEGNFYRSGRFMFSAGPVAEINLTVTPVVIRMLKRAGGDPAKALEGVPEHQRTRLAHELNGSKLKSSIAHELTHWYDDALHHQFIMRDLEKRARGVSHDAKKARREMARARRAPTKKFGDEYASPTEINAQIHQIRTLKAKLKRAWDKLSFDQMLEYDAALGNTADRFRQVPGLYERWKRTLLQRMAREGLLGAKMKGVATESRLIETPIRNDSDLPDDVVAAFEQLGAFQRGEPEQIMVKLQHLMGGGVLNVVVEHVGDLTHRMSHMAGWGADFRMGQDYVTEKAQRCLRYLNHAYGFEREMEENIRNNAKARGADPERLRAQISDMLEKYATAHSKLPVYNRPQFLARQAAVAVGLQQFPSAARYLERLLGLAENDSRWMREATAFERDLSGKLKQYNPTQGVSEAAYGYSGYSKPGEWYHGTASSRRLFVRPRGTHPSEIGIWLTASKDVAAKFASQASERMIDDVPVVATVRVLAENPMVFDTYSDYLEVWRNYSDSQKMRRALMRKGHDSVIIAQSTTDFGGKPRMDIAVFKPGDLKVLEKERFSALEEDVSERRRQQFWMKFTCGSCMYLAYVLSKKFGLSVSGILADEDFDGKPDEIVHVWVNLPDGRVADITGVHPAEEFLEEWQAKADRTGGEMVNDIPLDWLMKIAKAGRWSPERAKAHKETLKQAYRAVADILQDELLAPEEKPQLSSGPEPFDVLRMIP